MSQNLLSRETSPYLLQHKDNPVHWRPWGEAALAEAKRLDRPILLSVGYAACHWCHVMAHESFEDSATASVMNDLFINIKVDREERPDIDHLYMDALHALGEQGGWPLTMFLDPGGAPFWGGTYFPPESRYGRPGFKHVLSEISRIWNNEREKVSANSSALKSALAKPQAQTGQRIAPETIALAARTGLGYVDSVHGGMKGAPKFPQVPFFQFLWSAGLRLKDQHLRQAVETTLINICQGGIYDHIGGGFARYAVDAIWLVPHFEKMLYDNAQLVSLLARVWLTTGRPLFRIRIEQTIAFMLADMRTEGGAFAASYDADSEGHEGKYYVWTLAEVEALLGAGARGFAEAYDITRDGNWEGAAIPNRLHAKMEDEDPPEALRATLLAARKKRIPPGFDDKVLSDWNGLMIAGLAEAALVFENGHWRDAAELAFRRIVELLWDGECLRHSYRAGEVRHYATAEGYANMIGAALALHAIAPEGGYLAFAETFAAAMERDHWDGSAYAFASARATDLIARQVFAQDNATPNANAAMIGHLAKLAALAGKPDYRNRSESIAARFARDAEGSPLGFAGVLHGTSMLQDLVDVKAPPGSKLLAGVLKRTGLDIALNPRSPAADAVVICRGQTCAAPAKTERDVEDALALLGL
jgi:uncharacterized protein